jgi:putative DNA methylase
VVTRRQFSAELRRELEQELSVLLDSNIRLTDLAQATIGPGLAVFSGYEQVLESDGRPMSVRTALALINDELDRVIRKGDERLDAETRFCIDWYTQYGYASGPHGAAEVLGMGFGTPIETLDRAGVIESRGNKVRILKRSELDPAWDPTQDDRVPVWEALQHLIVRLEQEGIDGAGELLARVGDERGELSKQLAVRLYELCDRKRWAADARSYNEYARDFPEIQRAMQEDGARYDAYVREYPHIQEASRKFKIGYEQEALI